MARKMFGLCYMAETAGADIKSVEDDVVVVPNRDSAEAILEKAFQKKRGCPFYSLRDYVLGMCSTWKSIVWDQLRRDVAS